MGIRNLKSVLVIVPNKIKSKQLVYQVLTEDGKMLIGEKKRQNYSNSILFQVYFPSGNCEKQNEQG